DAVVEPGKGSGLVWIAGNAPEIHILFAGAGRGERLAIGRDGQGAHTEWVAPESGTLGSGGGIPELDAAAGVSSSQGLAVRSEGDGLDGAVMFRKRLPDLPARQVP